MYKRIIKLMLALSLILFAPTEIYGEEGHTNTETIQQLQKDNKSLNEEIKILKSTIKDYEKRISEIEEISNDNKEMFEIYQEYIKDIIVGYTVGATVIIGLIQLGSKLYLQNELRKYIEQYVTDEKIRTTFSTKFDSYINSKDNELRTKLTEYDGEFADLINDMRKKARK
ncbi:cell division protein FtsB [Anaerosolibacter carboniphilus]|uniref:Cell division protein FtsB n=1 Tax=Anaerosolibacter carboniphilus TaxID=1417629 RepID=A0A841L1L4_9FIRM|nr:hypothetical protein [Anaerosolibacter carboniphilus]MBB6216255.1 cell division protein FtsB [Anaerosolibacter carboniphilus]